MIPQWKIKIRNRAHTCYNDQKRKRERNFFSLGSSNKQLLLLLNSKKKNKIKIEIKINNLICRRTVTNPPALAQEEHNGRTDDWLSNYDGNQNRKTWNNGT